jgi:hypothetical protein
MVQTATSQVGSSENSESVPQGVPAPGRIKPTHAGSLQVHGPWPQSTHNAAPVSGTLRIASGKGRHGEQAAGSWASRSAVRDNQHVLPGVVHTAGRDQRPVRLTSQPRTA